jgi:hypothetical protein
LILGQLEVALEQFASAGLPRELPL